MHIPLTGPGQRAPPPGGEKEQPDPTPPRRKPRAGPEGDGSGPAQGLKVGVKGGLLSPPPPGVQSLRHSTLPMNSAWDGFSSPVAPKCSPSTGVPNGSIPVKSRRFHFSGTRFSSGI